MNRLSEKARPWGLLLFKIKHHTQYVNNIFFCVKEAKQSNNNLLFCCFKLVKREMIKTKKLIHYQLKRNMNKNKNHNNNSKESK